MVTYVNIDYNFDNCGKNTKAKLKKIDAIIDSLLNTALKSVANGNTIEYTLDTGQTKIHKVFSTTKSVTDAIKEYESIRQMYINQMSSRVVRLVDNKNFNRGR